LRIENLPNNVRIMFQVIMFEDTGSKPTTTGYVLASVFRALFDENMELLQGKHHLQLWPHEIVESRVICQGECFMKRVPEEGHIESVTMAIDMPTFHLPVKWGLKSVP